MKLDQQLDYELRSPLHVLAEELDSQIERREVDFLFLEVDLQISQIESPVYSGLYWVRRL